MWEGIDSQDVGLEAAIIKRKRNSSLVESACAEDVTGLKSDTEAADLYASTSGRGALCKPEKVYRKVCWRRMLTQVTIKRVKCSFAGRPRFPVQR